MKNYPLHSGGLINKVLPTSYVDGPGNRVVIFLQGCNMRCLYCHNPYTINICKHCGICIETCPSKALSFNNGKVVWDRFLCEECDNCIHVCPSFSTPKATFRSAHDLWEEVCEYAPFISGVSVSGGEPGLQIPFLIELFSLIKADSGLTTLIETNGMAGPLAFEPLLPSLDMAFVDLKCADPGLHLKLTRNPLVEVIKSIEFLHSKGKLFGIQQVIVPGFTDNLDQINMLAAIIKAIDENIPVKLLRFRPHGTEGESSNWETPSEKKMTELVAAAQAAGLKQVSSSL